MATLLLITIYIGFIGLGVPDSLLGSAWPAMYADLDLAVSFNGVLSLFTSICTAFSSILSARMIRRFGVARVTAVSTLLTALALLGVALSPGLWWILLMSIPLGLGAGAIDAGLNNYVALHYKASHMNFLHCFYGVGVSVSPYLMSLALGQDGNWRRGYLFAFVLQAIITLITFAALPLWCRVRHPNALPVDEKNIRVIPLREQVKNPDIWTIWLMFFGACAMEWTCGSWGGTFLFQSKGLSEAAAAGCVTLFYAGLALGRFLSGVLSGALSPRKLIVGGLGLLALGIGLLLLPAPFAVAGLFLSGLGVSPAYPNLVHLTPRVFGAEVSQSIMGTQMASAYVGVMAVPLLFGLLADLFGLWIMPAFLGLFLLLTGVTALRLIRIPLRS